MRSYNYAGEGTSTAVPSSYNQTDVQKNNSMLDNGVSPRSLVENNEQGKKETYEECPT